MIIYMGKGMRVYICKVRYTANAFTRLINLFCIVFTLCIYIYIIRYQKLSCNSFVVLGFVRSKIKHDERITHDVFYLKARAIKSGETPQKSLILPPVHTFIKVLVAPLHLMFSYFLGIFGGVKIMIL